MFLSSAPGKLNDGSSFVDQNISQVILRKRNLKLSLSSYLLGE
jgi:hypothetical protein